MPLRFHRSIRLARGLRLNLSKTGTSLSVGGRGATVNLSRRGARGTVGLPGTGISWSESLRPGRGRRSSITALVLLVAAIGAVVMLLGH